MTARGGDLGRTPAGRELIVCLSKKVLEATAPDELEGFEDFTGDYFTDPRALARSDDTLGAGFEHLPEVILLLIFVHRFLDSLYRRHVKPLTGDPKRWAAGILGSMTAPAKAREAPASFTPGEIHQALAAAALEMRQEGPGFVAEHWPKIQDLMLAHLARVRSGPTRPLRVLFLGASPRDAAQLALEREVAEIRAGLEDAPFRDLIHLKRELAVSPGDVQEHLLRHRPHLIHFSGHGIRRKAPGPEGSAAGPSRDLEDLPGHGAGQNAILLEDATGRRRPVSTAGLGEVFTALGQRICCVVLNACFSADSAEALAREVDCVVGMSGAIKDELAISFSRSFYQVIGYGESLATAFALGRSQIGLLTGGPSDLVRLMPGKADPSRIVPVSTSWRRPG